MTAPPISRRIDRVEPGYYRVRRVRGGPWIAAEVTVQDGMIYVAEDGASATFGIPETDYADMLIECVMEGTAFGHPLLRIAFFADPIDAAEYRHLLALRAWAAEHAPDHPMAEPDKPSDPSRVPISNLF